jgi:putative restriction endonuclease
MSTDYDAGFFKILARNDTGETGSHQGGIVLPRQLATYFPHLAGGVGPTADHEIVAELFDGPKYIETVQTRFQSQTWGGERSPEHRLTRNLRPLLRTARSGDIVVFQRQLGTVDRFRLTLIHQGTPEHKAIQATAKTGPVVNPADPPATQQDFVRAEANLAAELSKPFVPIEADAQIKVSLVQRRVRTELFQRQVRFGYESLCCVCGTGLLTPTGIPEVEAAHIIPRGENGTNDPRNGIALCCSHHWAFDRLLWRTTVDGKIAVPRAVSRLAGNASLVSFSGRALRPPREPKLAPAPEALEHHRKRSIAAWGMV